MPSDLPPTVQDHLHRIEKALTDLKVLHTLAEKDPVFEALAQDKKPDRRNFIHLSTFGDSPSPYLSQDNALTLKISRAKHNVSTLLYVTRKYIDPDATGEWQRPDSTLARIQELLTLNPHAHYVMFDWDMPGSRPSPIAVENLLHACKDRFPSLRMGLYGSLWRSFATPGSSSEKAWFKEMESYEGAWAASDVLFPSAYLLLSPQATTAHYIDFWVPYYKRNHSHAHSYGKPLIPVLNHRAHISSRFPYRYLPLPLIRQHTASTLTHPGVAGIAWWGSDTWWTRCLLRHPNTLYIFVSSQWSAIRQAVFNDMHPDTYDSYFKDKSPENASRIAQSLIVERHESLYRILDSIV